MSPSRSGPPPSVRPPDARLTVRVEDRSVPVELFLAEGRRPVVVVLHELWGINDDMRRICRRFVENGYHAALPDLYRGGRWTRCIWRTLVSLATEGPVVRDIEGILDALEAREDTGKVGVVGFCLGGGFAGLVGTRRAVGATGIFYGEPPTRARMERQMAPVVAGYGARDIPFARFADQLQRDCASLGIPHDVKLYPRCGHSYMGDAGHPVWAALARPLMRVAYDHEAAEDTWDRMLAFFAIHLSAHDDAQPA